MYPATKIERFNEKVQLKYQLFNSIFMTLPFDAIDNTGALLPLFAEVCEQGYSKHESPAEIFDAFIDKYFPESTEEQKINLMFRFIQYVERQVVLFDAIEDAAFEDLNNLEGAGSLRDIREKAEGNGLGGELRSFLNNFQVRTVLTAHPTQFYPGSVLGIITDLTKAIRETNLSDIKTLLAQLGKTPFIKKEKPTPFDEAVSLVWYLENVFYKTAGEMAGFVQETIYKGELLKHPFLSFGFWPGGDRDGNPFVTTEITLKVADRLRTSILKCYYIDIRRLRRKLTFAGVEDKVIAIEQKLYRSVFYSDGEIYISLQELNEALHDIRDIVINRHQSLYLDEIDNLLNKISLFGYHFASLDIRQNSRIHNKVFENIIVLLSKNNSSIADYSSLNEDEKINALNKMHAVLNADDIEDEDTQKTLESILAIKTIQERNGEAGANRYIISNAESALNVLELLKMFELVMFNNPPVDIVPLFETVEDLKAAEGDRKSVV